MPQTLGWAFIAQPLMMPLPHLPFESGKSWSDETFRAWGDALGASPRSPARPGTARPRAARSPRSGAVTMDSQASCGARSATPRSSSARGVGRTRSAAIARHWPEQDHATPAHLAAESLGNAGLLEEADRAHARTSRCSAAARCSPSSLRQSPSHHRACTIAGPGGGGGACLPTCAGDRRRPDRPGPVHRRTRRHPRPVRRPAGPFGALGADGRYDRTGAELAASRLEAGLGRTADAVARARGVLAAYESADAAGETVQARRAEATQTLRLAQERG